MRPPPRGPKTDRTMAVFKVEGGYRLHGSITPQGAKNEALQVICATLLTPERVTIRNIPQILDVMQLIELLGAMGVEIAEGTLHVGLGTFRPVKESDVLKHHMHSEFYRIEQSEADKINRAKQEGHRVIAVGTTSTRTLEAAADEHGVLHETSGWTEIFIYPGYQFKVIDALITNFHLPESTLVMLVSALAGREHVLHAYEIAVQERYRFFSFGDAMFITAK